MDDLERELRQSLSTVRDDATDTYRRTTWEARRETLERIYRRRGLRFVAAGALAATAAAAVLFVATRPDDLDRSEDLPITGAPVLEPLGVTEVGDAPRDLSVGGLGNVWSANSDRTVSLIEPSGAEVDRFDVPGVPGDIAIAKGPVWVALPEAGGVVEVRPSSGPEEPISVFDGPVDAMELTVGDGVLWVVARGEELAFVDAATRSSTTVELGDAPIDVAIHAGEVWVLSAGGRIIPIDQETLQPLDPIQEVVPAATGDLTYAGDSLWYFTGEDGDLTRLSLSGGSPTRASFDGDVVDLAIDPKVAWVLLRRGGTSFLQPLDRETGRAAGSAQAIAGEAAEAAIAHGFLWVTLTDRDEVARFSKS